MEKYLSLFGGIMLLWFFMVLDELSPYLHIEANIRRVLSFVFR